MPIIARMIPLALTSHITAQDVAAIVKACMVAGEALAAGKYVAALDAIAAQAPEALPLIEFAANALFPGSGAAIDILVHVTAHGHKMTPADEKAWFERQNPTPGL